MPTSLPRRHSALVVTRLLFPAVLLACVSTAWAGDITYNIVDYPIPITNGGSGPVDIDISGSLTTDGSFGFITTEDIIASSLFMEGNGGTATVTSQGSSPPLFATSDELMLPAGSGLSFTGNNTIYNNPQQPRLGGTDTVCGLVISGSGDGTANYIGLLQVIWSDGGPGHYIVTDEVDGNEQELPGSEVAPMVPWVIATASGAAQPPEPLPEPTCLTLLGTALLGVVAFYLRRRYTGRQATCNG